MPRRARPATTPPRVLCSACSVGSIVADSEVCSASSSSDGMGFSACSSVLSSVFSFEVIALSPTPRFDDGGLAATGGAGWLLRPVLHRRRHQLGALPALGLQRCPLRPQ